ncbi:MerR family transcriptional regulator [Bacillus safensis]
MTTYTLRHYREQDLVRPAKIAQNGYRVLDERFIYTFLIFIQHSI